MSNDKDPPANDATGTAAAAKPRRKPIVIGAAAAVLLLGGGGGAYMMSGGKADAAAGAHDTKKAGDGEAAGGGHGDAEGEGVAKPFDVPPMLVNLRTSDTTPQFLKVHIMLMPGDGVTEEVLKEKLPILLDSYQPFLRELRPEDLSGSAAVFRIKEELLLRANDALGDGQVKDVLVQDLIQQ